MRCRATKERSVGQCSLTADMAQVFETAMLVLFGISWPLNIAKSIKSRTAEGKSLLFELCIFSGYAIGLAGKLISGSITYVVVVYILDLIMVTTDLILTLRNRRLDKLRNSAAK